MATHATKDSPERGLFLEMYRWLVLSRTIEDKLHTLFRQSRLKGRLISGRGQEAIPVGAATALGPRDVIGPVHRDLGAHLVRGTTPLTVLRHYFGRVTGPSRGSDSDIHIGEWGRGVFPMVSHLPDSWPVLAGVSLGFSLAREARVALAFCGDGATSTGAWHEAVNFAAVRALPIVFVIENNQYAYSTPTHRQFRIERLADRAAAYGIEGVCVDGNDVVCVYETVKQAVEAARLGGGPSLVEAVTMRMDGHAVHDGARYVPNELLATWAERDPIARHEQRLREAGVADAEFEQIRLAAANEVTDSVRKALEEPGPQPSDLTSGVYAPVRGLAKEGPTTFFSDNGAGGGPARP